MTDYRIFGEHGLIVIWALGETSAADLIGTIEEITADPEFSPEYDMITDLGGLVTGYTSEEIRRLVWFVGNLPKGNRRARNAIIGARPVTFGTGRMFEMLAESTHPYQLMVVDSWEAALDWLGKEPDAIPARGSDDWERPPRGS